MTELVAKWACEYCTYENWPSAIKCTMCRAQRPSGGAIITEEPFKSSPALDASLHISADLSNSPSQGGSSLLICPDSSARPRVRIADVPEISSKWSCHMCTYLNWPRAIRCTQCLCQRQHTQQQQHGQHTAHQGQLTQQPRSPTESPQTSGTGCHPTRPAIAADPCEEYNDRNRLNTHAQHWTCTACTYENWAKALKCVVCDHPRPNSLLADPIQLASESESQQPSVKLNEQDRDNRRAVVGQGLGCVVGGLGGCSSSQRRSPPTSKRESDMNMDFQRIELASGAGIGSKEELEVDFKKLKQIKNRMRRTDWLFLNACVGEFRHCYDSTEQRSPCSSALLTWLSPAPVLKKKKKNLPHSRKSKFQTPTRQLGGRGVGWRRNGFRRASDCLSVSVPHTAPASPLIITVL